MSRRSGADHIDRAVAAARAGDAAAAANHYAAAARAEPGNAALLNSAGAFHAGRSEFDRALIYFKAAVAAEPAHCEAIVNAGLMLSRLGRAGDAARWFAEHETGCDDEARYWSARGSTEREARHLPDAATSYDRCLALDPLHPRALHGRARIALERGEDDMAARFKAALEIAPGEPELWLGLAQALDYQGDADQARGIAQTLCDQLPGWTDALELLAGMRWNAQDRADFAGHFGRAADAARDDRAIYRSWARTLAGADRFADAAAVAARARAAFPDDPAFALLEAVHAGEAGDDARAGAIFASLALDTTERRLHESRHWLRLGDPSRAEAMLARVVADDPGSIGGWALRDIAWRLLDDPRHRWLHGQDGLIAAQTLDIDDDAMAALVAALDRLHDRASVPIGQSVRDGTQTRGGLLDRHDAVFARLGAALDRAIARYRDALPPVDPAHPLLRHRDARWAITGSWSIRLGSHGYHTGHIHPAGIVSSAAYMVVPQDAAADGEARAGWLELGRPPADLRLDLAPVATIAPVAGRLALFPSTLYHGTRKFERGRRMTVAFDVAVEPS